MCVSGESMTIDLFEKFKNNFLSLKGFSKVDLEGVNILKYDSKNNSKFYLKETFDKTKIVLHHTVGNIYGDFMTLTTQNKVSVSYLIGREGETVELFDPKYWSYHLGNTALGGNKIQSRISIGIEISNYGYLIRKGDILQTVYGTDYCKISDTAQYEIKDYRGQQYWAVYTEEQYIALNKLLNYLTKKFNIPFEFLPVNKRMEYTQDVVDFKGIVAHVNYRKDKWDISPIFNWDKIFKN